MDDLEKSPGILDHTWQTFLTEQRFFFDRLEAIKRLLILDN